MFFYCLGICINAKNEMGMTRNTQEKLLKSKRQGSHICGEDDSILVNKKAKKHLINFTDMNI